MFPLGRLRPLLYVACFATLTVCWEFERHKERDDHDGYPYSIKGPSLSDRILIVGAGPAGIDMARLLKEMGYLHVNIFEASDRIGGKSLTVNRRGAPQELGTVYLSEDYNENVVKLLEKYQRYDTADLPSPSTWFTNENKPYSFTHYVTAETLAYLKTTDVLKAATTLLFAIQKYIALHNSLFGQYEGELMPRPNKTVLNFINGTAKEFFERENLYVLKPLFVAAQTILGYGQLDETPAFYIFLWNTPRLMTSLARRLSGMEAIGVYLLADGFQGLWKTVVEQEQLQVSLNSEVLGLKRTKRKVIVRHRNGPYWPKDIVESTFDFVMWSPELGQSLDKIGATRKERKLFSGAKPTFFTTTLIDESGTTRGDSPVDYWIKNVLEGQDHDVWAQRDSYSTLNGLIGPQYRNKLTPTGNDDCKERTSIVYQMGATEPTRGLLKRKLKRHFRALGGQIKIRLRKTWRYFPRYGVSDITKGILWDILEAQGKNRMFYIGSSVSFESAKSVMEYNKLLLRIMIPDHDLGWHRYWW